MVIWNINRINFTDLVIMCDNPRIQDFPNETRIDKVFEYYKATIDMVGNNIFSYGSPGKVLNDKTLCYGFDISPEI